MINIYEQVDRNKRRSIVVMVLFVVFITLFVWIIAKLLGYGPSVIGIALIFSGLLSFGSYWWSDKIILSISGARPAQRNKDFNFFTVAENLAMAARVPKPKLYVIDSPALNAFATGRDPKHAVICVTSGLLEKLNRTELEGVVAHELSHVKNYDTRLMSIVTVLVGMVVLIGDFFIRRSFFGGSRNRQSGNFGAIMLVVGIIVALLSPLIAKLIQLAISRRREFLADASAVLVTKFPPGLINALEKISKDSHHLKTATKATENLFIMNPFKGKQSKRWLTGLFNTHPPVEERINTLKGMS